MSVSEGGDDGRVSPSGPAEDRDAEAIVTKVMAGDEAAFEELYMLYFDRVYGYLRVLLKHEQEAEDVTQLVFIKALQALRTSGYEMEGKPFRAWLFVVARNCARDHWRAKGRGAEPAAPEDILRRYERRPGLAPDVAAAKTVDVEELRALRWVSDRDLMVLIERLPEPQRQVLFLRYVLDFDGPEIARILGRSPESTRQLQSRALRFLEQRLASIGREPAPPSKRRQPMRARDRGGAQRTGHAFSVAR